MGKKLDEKNIIEITSLLKKPVLYKKIDNFKYTNFYIGLGKTGSSTICNSLKYNCFHTHSTKTIDDFTCNILSSNNKSIYDLVKMYGVTFNYKPLIIECYREPISHLISLIFEFEKSKFSSNHPFCNLIPKSIIDTFYNTDSISLKCKQISEILNMIVENFNTPVSSIYNITYFKNNHDFDILEEFDSNKQYLYHEFNDYKLIILKFEQIANFKSFFNEIGYEYNDNKNNITKNNVSLEIKQNPKILGISDDIINKFYDNHIVRSIYTNDEINNFKNQYSCS